MSVREWLRAQIEKNAITAASAESVARSDQTFATRLVDAAGALRAGRGQAFGLEITGEQIEDVEALVADCLRAVEAWGPVLDDDSKAELGMQLARLGLPPVFLAPVPRERLGTLELLLEAVAEDLEGEPLDAGSLIALDDVETRDGETLIDVHAVAVCVAPWALETGMRLVHHAEAPRLRCELAFEAAEAPTDEQVAALVRVVERELFDTSWALNLEWELPDTLEAIIHVRPKVLAHRYESAVD